CFGPPALTLRSRHLVLPARKYRGRRAPALLRNPVIIGGVSQQCKGPAFTGPLEQFQEKWKHFSVGNCDKQEVRAFQRFHEKLKRSRREIARAQAEGAAPAAVGIEAFIGRICTSRSGFRACSANCAAADCTSLN